MWEKIVLNLISNAFKFTFEGEINIALMQFGEDVELRVRDTGVGIPKEHLPRLFDRFHRIENTRSRTHEGSGIGLALGAGIGEISWRICRARKVNRKGQHFIVSFPLGSAHLPADRIGGTAPWLSTALGRGAVCRGSSALVSGPGRRRSLEEIGSGRRTHSVFRVLHSQARSCFPINDR